MDSSNQTLSGMESSVSAVSEPLRQRDFLLQMRQADRQLLQSLASSANPLIFLDLLVQQVRELFPGTVRPCLIWCDKDLTNWRILNYADWQYDVSDPVGRVARVPTPLITFVASPSRKFGHEKGVATRSDWGMWHSVIQECLLESCHLVSVQDREENWLTMALFSTYVPNAADQSFYHWAIEQTLESVHDWIDVSLLRRETDKALQKMTDEGTGLLQPHAFDNAIEMMIRDARRYFQRLVFATVFVKREIDGDELKHLSDTLTSTLRDNDLLARSGKCEFVMAMRIGHLDDAQIIAEKIEEALLNADPKQIGALNDGVAIGVSFYPEQTNYNRLYLASRAAAEAVTEKVGYRLEYYGKFVKSLDEAYDL